MYLVRDWDKITITYSVSPLTENFDSTVSCLITSFQLSLTQAYLQKHSSLESDGKS